MTDNKARNNKGNQNQNKKEEPNRVEFGSEMDVNKLKEPNIKKTRKNYNLDPRDTRF